ncbi:MAG: nuclear transport factor 2 family protein [Chloroflexota bacterium]|nr:nuclear transport factor 2 family protein [Chloroflexota bacterium]
MASTSIEAEEAIMCRFPVPILVVAVIAALLAVRAPVAAQEATPIALPVTPDPAACLVAPRTIDDLYGLLGTPVPVSAQEEPSESIPASGPIEVSLPAGEPADSTTVTAITATIVEAYACFNAGDYLAAFALYSDDALQRFTAQGPFTEDIAAFFLATPEPFPEDFRSSVLAVRDVRVLADGRVGALVDTNDPTSPPEGADVDFVVFIEQEGRYLIDEEITDLEGSPAAGTPSV